jgi:23S rRNA pseudouridine2605 synthase
MSDQPERRDIAHRQPTPARDQEPGATPNGERLQKFLAHAGVASRRHAEELIAAGAVMVNGQTVRALGTRVNPETDEIRVRGKVVRPPEGAPLYVMMNKPADTVTTARDPQHRRTVLDLLPAGWRARRIYPVGRLDRGTEGLLLFTDDGELALRLTHPRYALPKEYHALVLGQPSREALRQLERGMLLAGETRPTAAARARSLGRFEGQNAWLSVEIHEGHKRQVRRMLEEIGHPTLRLKRVRIGPLTLGDLAPGASRLLTADEVAALRDVIGLSSQDDQAVPR